MSEIIRIDPDARVIMLSENTPDTYRLLQYVGANDTTDDHRAWVIAPLMDFDRVVAMLTAIIEGREA